MKQSSGSASFFRGFSLLGRTLSPPRNSHKGGNIPMANRIRNERLEITLTKEEKAQITLYENTLSELKKSYSKLPNSKEILDRLDELSEKKNTLMQEYSSSKTTMDELYKIRKNYGIYMGKEMER